MMAGCGTVRAKGHSAIAGKAPNYGNLCRAALPRLPSTQVLGRRPAAQRPGQHASQDPNHAHRAEVSLVAPSGRVGGLRATG